MGRSHKIVCRIGSGDTSVERNKFGFNGKIAKQSIWYIAVEKLDTRISNP